jgi:tetratricopeptide (TPR) repeat protein
MSNILLFIALALVLLWTARLARNKRRSPWLWGGAAFILMLIPGYNLLAVIPMIVLLFIKSPQARSDNPVDQQACQRCNTNLTPGSKFCTSCGWELSPSNPSDARVNAEKPADLVVEERRETTPASEMPMQEAGGEVQAPAQAASMQGATQAAVAPVEEAVSEPPPAGPRKRVPVDAPTADALTERGVRLYNQGRTQEAIDQFTKAIALDPNCAQAWARRAEAYARLGRGDEAEEDRRKLEALNPGSTGG